MGRPNTPSRLLDFVLTDRQQGSSVANVFLEEGGWHIRGLTRDPSKPSSRAWIDKGVELVKADVNDAASLKEAFAGSNVIFGVTDFWGAARDPKAQELVASTNRPITEVAYETEMQQARNIADAANATIETLDRFIFSVLSHAKKWSQGKITHNLHFDAKWEGVEYLKATHPALDKKTSYLQVGLYMTNWKGLGLLRPSKVTSMTPVHARLILLQNRLKLTWKKQPDGTFVMSAPMDGDAPIPMVEAGRDTGMYTPLFYPDVEWLRLDGIGKFAKALLQVEPGKNLLGYGSFIGWNEFAALWGKVHGVTCYFKRVDRKVLEEAIPGGVGEELADMLEYIAEFGYDGSDPTVVHPKDVSAPQRALRPVLTRTIAWRGYPSLYCRGVYQG